MNSTPTSSSGSELLKAASQEFAGLDAIQQRLAVLKSEARRIKTVHSGADFFERFLYRIDDVGRAAPAWRLQITPLATSCADRTASMLAGPLFCSEAFPWPMDQGTPMLSVAQIDLRVPSALQKLPLGDGLLQVFISSSGLKWVVRTIPRAIIEHEVPAAFPEFSDDQLSLDAEWAAPEGEYQAITGLEQPEISSYAECDEQTGDSVPEDVKRFVTEMNAVAGNCSGPPTLFGTFQLIQYLPSERPPCLLRLDSLWGFPIGASASAQIFFDMKDGDVEFTFEWSN